MSILRPGPIVHFAVLLGVSVWAVSAFASPPMVAIASGRLSGLIEGDVASFRGIPYAAAPVGDLRWRPPAPPSHWDGVRTADQFGPVCPQTLQKPPVDLPNQSEDCLSVNVFKPQSAKPQDRLPVMIWIHGGGFIVGAGGQRFYDGAALARHGVIVVTLNYRLGRLGFFAHPALVRESGAGGLFGNYGLMDQIAALKWVRDNIGAFSGDAEKITLFGESAGGMAVDDLMTTPLARGLFQRAIIESGLGRTPLRSLKSAEAIDGNFGAQHELLGTDAQVLAHLRALPVSLLIPNSIDMTGADEPRPLLDGRLLTEEVAEAFGADQMVRIPLIIGSNDHEDSLFPEARRDPSKVLSLIPMDALANFRAVYDPKGDAGEPKIAADYVVDSRFAEPARFLAHSQAAHGQPVWRYHFSYVQDVLRDHTPGAAHGAEVQYVFGSLGQRGPPPSASDVKTAELLQNYWTTFASTGDPNREGSVFWPMDKAEDDETLVIAPEDISSRKNFRRDQLDFIQSLIPKTGLAVRSAQNSPDGSRRSHPEN